MKKSVVLIISVLAVVLTSCQKQNKTSQTVTLRVADIHTEGYPTVTGLREFERLVEERTDGRIQIEVLTDGVEGDESNCLEKAQFGKIDFARISCAPLSSFAPEFEVFMMPGLFRNEEHFWKVLDGDIGQQLLSDLDKYNFVGLCYYDSGARSFYTSKKLKYFGELKGRSMRTQQSSIMLEFMNALGAVPIPIAFHEVNNAIEKGVIEGAENNIPSYESSGQYKSAPYYFKDEHTMVPDIIVGSKRTLSRLSASDLEIIRQAAKDSEEVQKKAWKEYERLALEKVINAGVEICLPDPEDKRATIEDVHELLFKKFSPQQVKTLENISSIN